MSADFPPPFIASDNPPPPIPTSGEPQKGKMDPFFYNMLKGLEKDYLKRYVGAAFLVVLVIGLGTGLVLIRQRQTFEQQASGSVQLTLSGPSSVTPGQIFDINILISPNGKTVSASELLIKFDTTKFEAVSTNPLSLGTFFPTGAGTESNGNGESVFLPNCSSSVDSACPRQSLLSGNFISAYLGVICRESGCLLPSSAGSHILASIRLKAKQGASGSSNIELVTVSSNSQTQGTRIAAINETGDQGASPYQPISISISSTGIASPTPTSAGGTAPSATPTSSGGTAPTATPTDSTRPTPTNMLPFTTATPTPIIVPDGNRLTISVKFQGIFTQKPDQVVKVTLTNTTPTTDPITDPITDPVTDGIVPASADIIRDVSLSANSQGVYTGSTDNIPPGTYHIYIKGPRHLQKKFENIAINLGVNTYNWSNDSRFLLLAGDILGNDNFVNALDLGKIIEDYFPNTPANSIADLNLDGTVNSIDIGFVIENYFRTGDTQ
jgi:hypothetical protein